MIATSEKINLAVVYKNPPELETDVVELPVPEPGPSEVVVRL
jgi:NADPH:quinone reductase-like Zn-dependent oxidoreductase